MKTVTINDRKCFLETSVRTEFKNDNVENDDVGSVRHVVEVIIYYDSGCWYHVDGGGCGGDLIVVMVMMVVIMMTVVGGGGGGRSDRGNMFVVH